MEDSIKRLQHIYKSVCSIAQKNPNKRLSTLVIDFYQPQQLKHLCKLDITYFSYFKGKVNEALINDIRTNVVPSKKYDVTIVSIQKSRQDTYFKIALGYQQTKRNGILVVEGPRYLGIESVLQELSKKVEVQKPISKSHGRYSIISVTSKATEIFSSWLEYNVPSKNEDGLYSVPGLFSYEKIDKGSNFLMESFDNSIFGSVIDLGAGWGPLSNFISQKCQNISSITLLDHDMRAVEAAKLNINHHSANFLWMDILEIHLIKKKFDFVICNPPFHTGRRNNIQLGLSFVNGSASLLKKYGCLLMVSNIHLPYEKYIKRKFHDFKIINQNKNFKILLATQPKNE